MNAFETAAVVEDPSHLVLSTPLPSFAGQACRVIVLFEEAGDEQWPVGFFDSVRIDDAAFVRPPQGAAPEIAALDV